MKKVHLQCPEVVYTRHRVVRIMDFPPAFGELSFSLDWTRSFIDRWEGSHDGRLCNLSFVSPPRVRLEEENLREEEQRAERTSTSNGEEKRTITPLRFVLSFFLPSIHLAPLTILLSLSLSFFLTLLLVLLVSRETCGGGVSGVNVWKMSDENLKQTRRQPVLYPRFDVSETGRRRVSEEGYCDR